MAPTSRLEKPSTRVYSSPKPTQPDSRTMGEASERPQKSTCRGGGRASAAAFMRRALYDARPMHTQPMKTPTLLALLCASAFATQVSATPALDNSVAKVPHFDSSDEIPSPPGYGDAYSLDEIRLGGQVLTEEQQVARWQAELAAGRARAGSLAGAYLSYRALTPGDCETARQLLLKADELGNDQAASLLAQLAGNQSCGDSNRVERERWLKKAVTLDYPLSAIELMKLYAESGNPVDARHRYVYARVAAGYWEAVKATAAREGFDTA